MNLNPLTRSRTIAVLVGAGALAVAGTTGAVASSLVTSHDIKDHTIRSVDMGNASVTHRVIKDGAVRSQDIRDGSIRGDDLTNGLVQQLGNSYTGANWSIVDRNVIGNGDAYLRSGPSSAPGVTPPMGIGSLGLRTGSGTDKAAFGDQVDFVGKSLSSVSKVGYSVFATGEDLDISPTNLPNIQFEVNPHTTSSYSTLVFVPQSADANAWTKIDASQAKDWYYTGAFGTASGCNQTTYCTLAEAKAAAPDATLLTVQFSKGRDNAFSGAVDALQIGGKVYDFEPDGVHVSRAH